MTLDRDLDTLREGIDGCRALGLIDLPSGFLFSFGGPEDQVEMMQEAGKSAARLFQGAPQAHGLLLEDREEIPAGEEEDLPLPHEGALFLDAATVLMVRCNHERDAIAVFLCDPEGDRNLSRRFTQARDAVQALQAVPWGRF